MNLSAANEKGFTLIELLIAITIFAVGLLSIASMQISAIRTNAAASTLTAATALAGGILEEILAWPRTDARLAADSSNNNWDFDPGPETLYKMTLDDGARYSSTYGIDADYQGEVGLSRIEVVVNGSGRTITLVGFKRI